MRHVPFVFDAVDPQVLRKVPANAGLLAGMPECLEGTARPEAIPWRVGRFNVTTHPDLVEWTAQLAGEVGARFAFVCGRPVILAADDRILGWGRGTHDFVVRAAASSAPEILAQGGRADERYGPGWLAFPAFLPDVPRAQHVATIARWLEAARDA